MAPTDAEQGLDQLVDEFISRYRGGERPSLTEYEQRHPELAGQIRELFPALVLMEEFGSVDEATRSGVNGEKKQADIPRQLGDFRILREVGRGGMGIVYESIQESLGRHVALKVLPFNALAKGHYLERFRREAQAAAKLHHTNIVSVFGVGEQDGIHYYAMQFIQGQSLDLVLQDVRRLRSGSAATNGTPTASQAAMSLVSGMASTDSGARNLLTESFPASTPRVDHVATFSSLSIGRGPYFRSIARVGAQVADALAYAHKQGVLHRDVKPSNLLLDVHGSVWITDFGLAKSEGTDELTHPGDIVGTLCYMAPERFEGISNAAGDIYSLGMTLYEMLTLRAGFTDSDRARLIDRIRREEPPPPRKLDPLIPADLETIILKAIAKEPASRYRSAEEMAEDLQRFLSDRPILARRASAKERLWRWCRRNPAVAALSGSLFLALIVLALVSLGSAFWLKEQRDEARGNLSRAERAEGELRDQLWQSYRDQARAGRFSGAAGRRFQSLKALRNAAEIRFDPSLRDEAIACLALMDVEPAQEWEGLPPGHVNVFFDRQLERQASWRPDGGIILRHISDNSDLGTLPGPLGSGQQHGGSIAFSPDGQLLAARYWSGLSARVWRIATREAIAQIPNGNQTFGFGPDSRRIVFVQNNGVVILHDLVLGKEEARWNVGGNPSAMALHPDGQSVAVAFSVMTRAKIQIRKLPGGEVMHDLAQPADAHSLAWRGDGKLLAVGGEDDRVYLWDISGTPRRRLLGAEKNGGIQVAFNHAGDILASAGWEGSLRLWCVASGRLLLQTRAVIEDLRFSPDDQLLAAEVRGTHVRFLRVSPNAGYRTIFHDPVRKNSLNHAAFGMGGQVLSWTSQSGIHFWDLNRGHSLGQLRTDGAAMIHQFDRSGNLLAGNFDELQRWPVKKLNDEWTIGLPRRVGDVEGNSTPITMSADGQRLVVSRGAEAALLDPATGRTLRTFGPHADLRFIAITPNGQWLATGSHGGDSVAIKVWNIDTGEKVKELPGETITRVAFSPDGRWLATGGAHCRLWHVGTWKPGPVIRGIARTCFGFSPDSQLIAVETGEGVIQLVHVESGRELVRLENPLRDRAFWLGFAPDGARLISISNDTDAVHCWNLHLLRSHLTKLGLDAGFPIVPEPPAGSDVRMRIVQR